LNWLQWEIVVVINYSLVTRSNVEAGSQQAGAISEFNDEEHARSKTRKASKHGNMNNIAWWVITMECYIKGK
jgi:hypothetical protein